MQRQRLIRVLVYIGAVLLGVLVAIGITKAEVSIRQVDFAEVEFRVCANTSTARALPQSTMCWDHVPRITYEVSEGGSAVTIDVGADGYEAGLGLTGCVAEPPGCGVLILEDIPWSLHTSVDEDGITHQLWKGATSYSLLRLIEYEPGVTFQACVRWYSDDVEMFTGSRLFSKWGCLPIEWEMVCPPQWDGDDSTCRLTVIE